MLKFFIFCFLILASTNVFAAQQLTNKELAQLCDSDDRWYGGLCNGYITGTVESLLEMREQGLIAEAFCFPANTQRGQFIDIIRQSLTQTIKSRSAFESIVLTLREKYPCE